MTSRWFAGALAAALALGDVTAVRAQEVFKVGLILPMTGPFASTGRQIEAAVKLFMQRRGRHASPARRSRSSSRTIPAPPT